MFKKLFTITCVHQYFGGSQCNDLQIEPTAECNTLLKNYRLMFKQVDACIYSILIQQPDSTIKIPFLSSALTFYIFITSDEFYNYTKYPAVNKSFTADVSTTNTTNVKVHSDSTLWFTGVNSNVDSSSFVVTEKKKPSPFSLQNRKLFGVISIAPPSRFCNYILTLEAIGAKWRYYIIADKSVKNVEVKEKVKDQSAASERIVFKNITNTMKNNAIYQAVKASFPDAGVFINESNKEILSVRRPGRIVQLWNVTDKNRQVLLMDNLPLPSCRDNGQKIIYVRSKNNDY